MHVTIIYNGFIEHDIFSYGFIVHVTIICNGFIEYDIFSNGFLMVWHWMYGWYCEFALGVTRNVRD